MLYGFGHTHACHMAPVTALLPASHSMSVDSESVLLCAVYSLPLCPGGGGGTRVSVTSFRAGGLVGGRHLSAAANTRHAITWI